jgi:Effector-associated domain 1
MPIEFVGDQVDRLCAALESAYKTFDGLETFTYRKLHLNLASIASNQLPMDQICTKFVQWVDAHDTRTEEILTKLEECNNNSQAVIAICREIKGGAGRQVIVLDPTSAQVILNSRAFCDRDTIREEVKKLATGYDQRVLIINGESKVGKSQCLAFLAHLAHVGWKSIRIVSIDLLSDNDPAIRPDDLVRRIALDLGVKDEPPSPRSEQSDARWLGDLVTWLNRLLRGQGEQVWIVLDGFRHVLVPQMTHDFISYFATKLPIAAPNVRFILLDYARLIEDSDDIRIVTLEYISDEHLVAFRRWVVENILLQEPEIADVLYHEIQQRMPREGRDRMQFLGKMLPRLVIQLMEAQRNLQKN